LEELARALMEVAFAGAGEMTVGAANKAQQAVQTAAALVDSIEEIKRYKALLEEGIITEEEFTAKKKQLLGI
jgi:predicted Zn-dependent peptidase